MSLLTKFNKILSRFGLEILLKKDLDKLVYSASINRNIHSVKMESMPNPFDDQQYLIAKKNPIIFDVGSYVGEVACLYANSFENSSVYAFEPTMASFHELEKNTHNISNIYVSNVAFSDSNKRSKFYLNKFSPTNSLLATSNNAHNAWGEELLDTQEAVYIECQTIDSFCRNNNIQHIDILKLDVQGNESAVLNGAINMFNEEKISLVYTEIIFAETYQNQTKLTDLMQFMDNHQFVLFNFYNPKYLARQLIQADMIFMHRSLARPI